MEIVFFVIAIVFLVVSFLNGFRYGFLVWITVVFSLLFVITFGQMLLDSTQTRNLKDFNRLHKQYIVQERYISDIGDSYFVTVYYNNPILYFSFIDKRETFIFDNPDSAKEYIYSFVEPQSIQYKKIDYRTGK
jgi:hypothetical protein